MSYNTIFAFEILRSMKIITYNVNGIRAAIKKGLITWLLEQDADIICFQETKSQPEQVSLEEFENSGYHAYWHSAVKKGYSGVLTLSKVKVTETIVGMSVDKYDVEGRVLQTQIGEWTILNCYFPSGSSGEQRHAFKMEFLQDFEAFMKKLQASKDKIIVVGDYNVVHQEMDIHNPQRKDKPSGYRPEERAWMDQWFSKLGFVDAFRSTHPEKIEFSWWSYRAGSRPRNKGWRIDYISVSGTEAGRIVTAEHHKDAEHSDHCALSMVII